uniref:Uncharacterized protein n=1 Tax=Triticum urartu TaxID=4572 RepID=A0A8R7QAV0_TRIUA
LSSPESISSFPSSSRPRSDQEAAHDPIPWFLIRLGLPRLHARLTRWSSPEVTHLMMFTARRGNNQRPRKCGHTRGRFSRLQKSGDARSAAPTHVCVVGGLAKICILHIFKYCSSMLIRLKASANVTRQVEY